MKVWFPFLDSLREDRNFYSRGQPALNICQPCSGVCLGLILDGTIFVTCDKLMTGLQHKLFRVSQTYNSLMVVLYVRKNVVKF